LAAKINEVSSSLTPRQQGYLRSILPKLLPRFPGERGFTEKKTYFEDWWAMPGEVGSYFSLGVDPGKRAFYVSLPLVPEPHRHEYIKKGYEVQKKYKCLAKHFQAPGDFWELQEDQQRAWLCARMEDCLKEDEKLRPSCCVM